MNEHLFRSSHVAFRLSILASSVEFEVEEETDERGDSVIPEAEVVGESVLCRIFRRKFSRSPNITQPVELSEWDLHNLCHFPKRADCEVCNATKCVHAPFKRGSASNAESPGSVAGGVFLVMDWVSPSSIASNGARYMAVIANVTTGAIFTKAFAVKKNNSSVALHGARVAWGLEGKSFTLHSDNEKILTCPEMATYLREGGKGTIGVRQGGVPHRSNSNAYAERYVRRACEDIRALMFQAGLPDKAWHLALDTFNIENARGKGIEPRFSTVRRVPFGCLGKAKLPAGLLFRDKFQSRAIWVMNAGPKAETSGGVSVLFVGASGKIRRGTVFDRDINWKPSEFALSRTRKGLRDVVSLFPDFASVNPVLDGQIHCETCDRWRFCSNEVCKEFEQKNFVCSDIGLACEDKEDPRVWGEIEQEDFPENNGALEFDLEEETSGDLDKNGDEVIVRARRCKVAAEECLQECPEMAEVVDGGTPNTDEETRAALLRLGAFKCDVQSLEKLRETARREITAEKTERVVVCAVVVKNRDALNESNPARPKWLDGMDTEMSALLNNSVVKVSGFEDVKCGDEVLPALIVLTVKSDGRHKARLVVCGNFQKGSNADPASCYAGVVSHDSWLSNALIALAAGQDMAQIDVVTAFLQTDPVDTEKTAGTTFIRVPKDMKHVGHIGGVPYHDKMLLRVVKSLYGLKTAPAAWKRTLERYLGEIGFVQSLLDDTVWVDRKRNLRVLLYVDDLIMLGDRPALEALIKGVSERFDCTQAKFLRSSSREEPLLFLGHNLWLEVGSDRKEYFHVSQEEYAREVLKNFGMGECRPLLSLNPGDFERSFLEGGEKLGVADQSLLRSILGALQYLAGGTRSDLLAPTSTIAEGQSAGTSRHLESAKKLIRYVAGTVNLHLVLPVNPISKGDKVTIDATFDAAYGHERARMGAAIFVNDALCLWYSRRQKSVCLSTAEAELVSATACSRELIGLRNALREQWAGVVTFEIVMRGDNRASNLIAGRQCSLRRVRHLCLADLYVREVTRDEGLRVVYVPTGENPSDVLTKVLPRPKIEPLLPRLCLYRD